MACIPMLRVLNSQYQRVMPMTSSTRPTDKKPSDAARHHRQMPQKRQQQNANLGKVQRRCQRDQAFHPQKKSYGYAAEGVGPCRSPPQSTNRMVDAGGIWSSEAQIGSGSGSLYHAALVGIAASKERECQQLGRFAKVHRLLRSDTPSTSSSEFIPQRSMPCRVSAPNRPQHQIAPKMISAGRTVHLVKGENRTFGRGSTVQQPRWFSNSAGNLPKVNSGGLGGGGAMAEFREGGPFLGKYNNCCGGSIERSGSAATLYKGCGCGKIPAASSGCDAEGTAVQSLHYGTPQLSSPPLTRLNQNGAGDNNIMPPAAARCSPNHVLSAGSRRSQRQQNVANKRTLVQCRADNQPVIFGSSPGSAHLKAQPPQKKRAYRCCRRSPLPPSKEHTKSARCAVVSTPVRSATDERLKARRLCLRCSQDTPVSTDLRQRMDLDESVHSSAAKQRAAIVPPSCCTPSSCRSLSTLHSQSTSTSRQQLRDSTRGNSAAANTAHHIHSGCAKAKLGFRHKQHQLVDGGQQVASRPSEAIPAHSSATLKVSAVTEVSPSPNTWSAGGDLPVRCCCHTPDATHLSSISWAVQELYEEQIRPSFSEVRRRLDRDGVCEWLYQQFPQVIHEMVPVAAHSDDEILNLTFDERYYFPNAEDLSEGTADKQAWLEALVEECKFEETRHFVESVSTQASWFPSDAIGGARASVEKRLGVRGMYPSWLCSNPNVPVSWDILRLRTSANSTETLITFAKSPADFRGFVDPVDPHLPYPPAAIGVAALYLLCLVRRGTGSLRPGRFLMAQALKTHGPRMLRGLTLGQLCHLVQLLLTHRFIAYDSHSIRPVVFCESLTKAVWARVSRQLSPSQETAVEKIRQRMAQLLREHRDGIVLSQLTNTYESVFDEPFEFFSLGYTKLAVFLRERMHDVCRMIATGPFNSTVLPALPTAALESESSVKPGKMSRRDEASSTKHKNGKASIGGSDDLHWAESESSGDLMETTTFASDDDVSTVSSWSPSVIFSPSVMSASPYYSKTAKTVASSSRESLTASSIASRERTFRTEDKGTNDKEILDADRSARTPHVELLLFVMREHKYGRQISYQFARNSADYLPFDADGDSLLPPSPIHADDALASVLSHRLVVVDPDNEDETPSLPLIRIEFTDDEDEPPPVQQQQQPHHAHPFKKWSAQHLDVSYAASKPAQHLDVSYAASKPTAAPPATIRAATQDGSRYPARLLPQQQTKNSVVVPPHQTPRNACCAPSKNNTVDTSTNHFHRTITTSYRASTKLPTQLYL